MGLVAETNLGTNGHLRQIKSQLTCSSISETAMSSFKCLPWIIFAIVFHVNSEISLRSSLGNGTRVCPGDEIIFTCETVGSSQMIWRSDQYIGTGGAQLELFLSDTPGRVASSGDNSAVATLISTNVQSRTIVSTLRIIASSDMSNPSVTCVHSANMSIHATSHFQYVDVPDPPSNPVAIEILDERSTDQCIIFVEWDPPVNIDESDIAFYLITSQSESITTVESSVRFLIQVPDCEQEIVLNIATVNRCDNVSKNSTVIKPTEVDIGGQGSNSVPLIVGGVVGGVGIILAIISLVLTLVCFLYMSRRRDKVERDSQKEGLIKNEQRIATDDTQPSTTKVRNNGPSENLEMQRTANPSLKSQPTSDDTEDGDSKAAPTDTKPKQTSTPKNKEETDRSHNESPTRDTASACDTSTQSSAGKGKYLRSYVEESFKMAGILCENRETRIIVHIGSKRAILMVIDHDGILPRSEIETLCKEMDMESGCTHVFGYIYVGDDTKVCVNDVDYAKKQGITIVRKEEYDNIKFGTMVCDDLNSHN